MPSLEGVPCCPPGHPPPAVVPPSTRPAATASASAGPAAAPAGAGLAGCQKEQQHPLLVGQQQQQQQQRQLQRQASLQGQQAGRVGSTAATYMPMAQPLQMQYEQQLLQQQYQQLQQQYQQQQCPQMQYPQQQHPQYPQQQQHAWQAAPPGSQPMPQVSDGDALADAQAAAANHGLRARLARELARLQLVGDPTITSNSERSSASEASSPLPAGVLEQLLQQQAQQQQWLMQQQPQTGLTGPSPPPAYVQQQQAVFDGAQYVQQQYVQQKQQPMLMMGASGQQQQQQLQAQYLQPLQPQYTQANAAWPACSQLVSVAPIQREAMIVATAAMQHGQPHLLQPTSDGGMLSMLHYQAAAPQQQQQQQQQQYDFPGGQTSALMLQALLQGSGVAFAQGGVLMPGGAAGLSMPSTSSTLL